MFCCLVVVFLLLCFFRSGLVTTATLTLDTFDCNHTPLTTTEETNFKAFSNVQCALQCLAVSDCGGYSFDRRTSICEIFDVLPVSAPTHASKRYYPKPQQELFVSNTEDVCTTNSPCQNGGLCRRDCRRNEGYICTCNEVIWTGKQCEDNAQYVIYTGAAPQTDTDDAQSTVSCPASSMTIMTCRCNMEFCDGAKLMNDTCVAYNDNIADGNKVKAEIGCSTNVHPDDVITLSSGVVLNPIVSCPANSHLVSCSVRDAYSHHLSPENRLKFGIGLKNGKDCYWDRCGNIDRGCEVTARCYQGT